jgi:hypothetical protein
LALGLEAFLVGFFSIPLVLPSFGGPNLGYGVPMRCSYYPQSLVQNRRAIRGIGGWIWGSWPAGVVHSPLCGSPNQSFRPGEACLGDEQWRSRFFMATRDKIWQPSHNSTTEI